MKVLVFNVGSSSVKSSLFSVNNNLHVEDPPLWQAQISWRAAGRTELEIKSAHQSTIVSIECAVSDAVPTLLDALRRYSSVALDEVAILGHRVVHGGDRYVSPTLLTKDVLSYLYKLIELAPAHEAAAIQCIEKCAQLFKGIPQIAVFDTAFHSSMPTTAKLYAVPYSWHKDLGITRYGFHGISHEFCAHRAAELLQRDLGSLKIINCHLGSGASLCAIKDGKSQMTTMGYTPLDGLVMGTRCGAIDPGIVLHLLSKKIFSVEELTHILYEESGLKGISELTSDLSEIEKQAQLGNAQAQLAFDIYVDRLSSSIASLLPFIDGLDVLVFTGGIGQNSSTVRSATVKKLKYLGITLDQQKNSSCQTDAVISGADSKASIVVLHTREDLAIAQASLPFASR